MDTLTFIAIILVLMPFHVWIYLILRWIDHKSRELAKITISEYKVNAEQIKKDFMSSIDFMQFVIEDTRFKKLSEFIQNEGFIDDLSNYYPNLVKICNRIMSSISKVNPYQNKYI